MNKMDLDNVERLSTTLYKEDAVAFFKETIRKKGILPIIKDNRLCIYKMNGSENLPRLSKEYKRKYCVIESITNDNNDTYSIKIESKLSKIIDYILSEKYFDLELIACLAYEFIYSKNKWFENGATVLTSEQYETRKTNFTSKEKDLSIEEKYSIIKDIYNNLNIECVFDEDINNISEFILETIFETQSKNMVIEFACHNSYVLYGSEFTEIYNRMLNTEVIKLTKKTH